MEIEDANASNNENIAESLAPNHIQELRSGTKASECIDGVPRSNEVDDSDWTVLRNSYMRPRYADITSRGQVRDYETPTNRPARPDVNRNQNTELRQTLVHRKCILVNDGTIKDSNEEKFSRQFDVIENKSTSIAVVAKDTKFKGLLENLNPEAIFIHVGSKDVLLKLLNANEET